jgi:hypothetical protein
MSEGIIDLSAARPQPITKVTNTVEDVKVAIQVYKKTMQEAIDVRFGYMQELPKAVNSRIQPLEGKDHPAADINARLQFLDRTIRRLTDLIIASAIVIDHENDPSLLNAFPTILAKRQEVIDTIVDNVNKKLEETTHEEAMLVAGFRDLERQYQTLRMVK